MMKNMIPIILIKIAYAMMNARTGSVEGFRKRTYTITSMKEITDKIANCRKILPGLNIERAITLPPVELFEGLREDMSNDPEVGSSVAFVLDSSRSHFTEIILLEQIRIGARMRMMNCML